MSRIFAHLLGSGLEIRYPRDVLPRSLSSAALVLAAISGCLSAYAPPIAPVDHHASVEAADGRGGDGCLDCHELESSMAERMRTMDAQALAQHMEAMEASDDAPLVQDWMIEDPRGCLECHRLRPPKGARR